MKNENKNPKSKFELYLDLIVGAAELLGGVSGLFLAIAALKTHYKKIEQ